MLDARFTTALGGAAADLDFAGRRTNHATNAARVAGQVLRELAIQDWVALAYLLVLLGVTLAGDGPRRARAIAWLAADLAVFLFAMALSRSKAVRGIAGALVYRAGLFAAVFGSFSQLQLVLPTARSARLDSQIHAFDLQVFGVEPAVALDAVVTPAKTEWFAFFYFSYFVIVAVHVLAFMFAERRQRLLSEFSLGFVLLFCVAHVLYVVVPGYGPYQHLASQLQHPLEGAVWWPMVKATVDSVEVTARTDIFPSLHTAVPIYFALFSFRHRRHAPFKYVWLPLGFFASQIVISTMYLRWHYLVDVVAGITLAATVLAISSRLSAWEARRRDALSRAPVWTVPWSELAARLKASR